MKKSTITILMLCILLFPYCGKKNPTTPDIPSYIPDPEASFILESSTQGYDEFGNCEITGTIKNVGKATGFNVMIEFQAYNASDTIIDTANGFPADLGKIPVGISATFEASFFDTHSWSLIAKTTYEITWLTVAGVSMIQTGVVF